MSGSSRLIAQSFDVTSQSSARGLIAGLDHEIMRARQICPFGTVVAQPFSTVPGKRNSMPSYRASKAQLPSPVSTDPDFVTFDGAGSLAFTFAFGSENRQESNLELFRAV